MFFLLFFFPLYILFDSGSGLQDTQARDDEATYVVRVFCTIRELYKERPRQAVERDGIWAIIA